MWRLAFREMVLVVQLEFFLALLGKNWKTPRTGEGASNQVPEPSQGPIVRWPVVGG